MAITNTGTAITPPAYKRVMSIVFFNGSQGLDANGNLIFTNPPYAEIVVQGCNPINDPTTKTQMTNAFGQPAWEDVPGWIADVKITDAATLQSFMALWGQIMTAAETQIANTAITKL